MNTVHKGNSTADHVDIDMILKDIATLRHDLASVTREIGQDVSDGVVLRGNKAAKAITTQITDQPVLSLLLAFALGALGGRLLSH
jgi:hypothetical protein